MAEPVGVAVVGASGYAAHELIQILLRHPGVKIAMATSRQDERLDALHPSLASRINLACEPFDADRVAEQQVRVPRPPPHRQHGDRPLAPRAG